MSKIVPIDPLNAVDAARRDTKMTQLRASDTQSLKEIGKSAYSHVAKMRTLLLPYEEDLAMVRAILIERMVADKRATMIDDAFTIKLEFGEAPVDRNDGAIVSELHALKIDGESIPEDELEGAAWMFTPPPPKPEPKTNLTKLKGLVKQYGKPVQDIIDKYIKKGEAPIKRLVFEPKEDQHAANA
jgi:hypothetical protein